MGMGMCGISLQQATPTEKQVDKCKCPLGESGILAVLSLRPLCTASNTHTNTPTSQQI